MALQLCPTPTGCSSKSSPYGQDGLHTLQGVYPCDLAYAQVVPMLLFFRYLHHARWYFVPVLVMYTS